MTTQVLTPTADASVIQSLATTNFGADAQLFSVGAPGAAGSRETFLRFVLPAAPSGEQIESVTLTLWSSTDAAAPSSDTFDVQAVVDSGWVESTVNWNTRPATNTGSTLGSFVGPAAVQVQQVVTLNASPVAAAAGSTITLRVAGRSSGVDVVRWFSKDYSVAERRPSLTLTYVTIPAPVTGPKVKVRVGGVTRTATPKVKVGGVLRSVVDIHVGGNSSPTPADPLRFIDVHDMTSSDRTINSSGSYWDTGYIDPDGEGGIHRSYGGYTRDKPTPRTEAAATGTTVIQGVTVSNYQIQSAIWEVAQAKAAGIDGFLGNMMSGGVTSGNHQRAMAMAYACAQDGTMRYTPNVDANGGISDNATVAADRIAEVYATGCARTVNGKYLLSSFKAEGQTVAWWTGLKADLASRGYPTEFIAVLLNASDANYEAFAPISWALSVWGPGRPQNVSSLAGRAQKAHALGRKFMAPVRPQDARPRSNVYAEAQNTDLFRGMWDSARLTGTSAADCIQMITWDDFAEHTHLMPSVGGGDAWMRLTKVYGDSWRTGLPVSVTSPLVVLTHRVHHHTATGSISGLTPMAATLDGTSTPRSLTEALCILPAAGTVSVNGGTPVAVPANTPTAVTAALVVGSANTAVITGQAGGTFTVTSAHTTTATPTVQDFHYKATTN